MALPPDYQQLPLFAAVCPGCDLPFAPKQRNSRYCSHSCYYRVWVAEHKEQYNASKRKWNANNQDYFAAWHAAHPGKPKEYREASKQRNPDKARVYVRGWRSKNVERARANGRRYIARHRDEVRAKGRAWQKANPKKVLAGVHRRLARLRQAEGQWTAADVERIYQEQAGLCAYCGIALNGVYDVEHKIPLSRGGTNWPDNLCCACDPCNTRKGARTPEEFATYLATAASRR